RCRGIIKGLLDFSRPAQPMRKPTDLNEVARRAVAVVMSQLSLRHVSLSLDLAEELPTAQADANQIQQVVVNLLLNAADAIGEGGGTIAVSTRTAVMPSPHEADPDAAPSVPGEPCPAVELTVADDGCGIPPEDLPHLFEPFFSTKGNRGTGLGLAVTWGLVEAHGGRIDVQSQPGHGARFTVRIPLASGPQVPGTDTHPST
ncbi:MAG TPA: ATP-binding protein, partial [Holophagaceae bacterium]